MISMLLALAVAQGAIQPTGSSEQLPEEFTQLLPRGRIASVDHPEFVPAAKAQLPADAWVFGIVVGGEARAYSLNLLNVHEVVNDRVGGRPIAAVW